ncbi:hypothetical protein YC2023_098728 [Brassica napus]
MFPKWEFDVEDTLAENIIKLMFVKKPWKWTMDCWEVTSTWVNTKPAVVSPVKKKVVKEDSPRSRKKARKEAPAETSGEAAAEASEEAAAEASEEMTTTVGGLTKEDIKTMFKDIADAMREGFGTCLKEIKYLSERVEAVEKKVGITTKRKRTSSQNTTSPPKPTLEPESESVNGTNAGRKSLAEDKGPDVPTDVPTDVPADVPATVPADVPAAVPADASSSEDKAPEPSLVLLDKNQSTVSDLQKEDARYLEKRDAALALCRAKSDRTRKLADVPADVPAAVPADASSSEDKAPEPSLVLLDKNQSTVSDLQKEDARYLEKRDAALALCRAKSDRTRKLAASQKSPYTANRTARVIISKRKLYPGYNPFASIDKTKLRELADWLKSCP